MNIISNIHFIDTDNKWNIPFSDCIKKTEYIFRYLLSAIKYDYSDIRARKFTTRFADSLLPQLTLIIQPRCVDHDNRSKR